MLIRSLNLIPFFKPESDVSTGGKDGNMSKDDVIEFLGSDDEPEVINLDDKKSDSSDKKDDKSNDKDDDKEDKTDDENKDDDDDIEVEDDELKDIEDDLEDPDEEKLELTTPVRRRDILKKYPKLFEDFPYLEKAYYREQQFTELLPTIEDAKEAVSKSETLDKFEADLVKGDTKTILTAIKNESPKSFTKIVDNYLGVLAEVDKDSYHHVIGNIVKHTIIAMVKEAKSSGNDALQSAAQVLNQYVFGSSDFVPPRNLSSDEPDEKDSKEAELSNREREFNKQRFETANEELNFRVNNAYKSTISAHIDPRGSMTEYVKRNAIREATENLESLITQDKRFRVLVDKLWDKSSKENYSKASIDTIKSAFLSKAKTLLPSVIKKARQDALKGMGKRTSNKTDDDTNDDIKDIKTNRKDKDEPSSRKSTGKVPAGMSSLEFLMSDD